MDRFAMRLIFSLWIAAAAAQGLGTRAAAGGSAAPAERLSVLFILDDSGSMKLSDPSNRRYAAAALFIAALDDGDRAGALGFATGSRPVTAGMVEIAGQQSRAGLIALLQPVQPDGYTDVKAAFEAAQAMLATAGREGFHTVVVFLTDGKPEVPGMTAGYQEQALAAARALRAPVYAVALTAQGQTPFLDRLAAGTGGRVIPAARADDLLDSFLTILGELKDRTVLGQQGGAITLDPRLAPYVEKITFLAVHPQAGQVQLLGPDGAPAAGAGAAIALPGDLRITPLTVAAPAPGEWRFEQAAQVRAILYARLRARVTAPPARVEAGSPVTITAELLEEQADGALVKIIGEASFSALVTLPGGQQESLDVFYDDGTHGDVTAGDGVFSRLFPNTAAPGQYRIRLQGRKGQVPVGASASFQAEALPEPVVIQPALPRYELRGQPVPLEIRLPEESAAAFQGGFAASITGPDGSQALAALEARGGAFTGQFYPGEDGAYQVVFLPQQAAYLGIPYHRAAQAEFTVKIVPAVTLQSARLAAGRGPYETGAAERGIPVELVFSSTSARDEALRLLAEGAGGMAFREPMPLDIPPGVSRLTLHLAAEPGAAPGDRRVALRLAPPGPGQVIDLHSAAGALEFTLFEPTITWSVETVASCGPGPCWQACPPRILVRAASTSARAEAVTLRLEGLGGASLSRGTFEIPPGESEIALEILPPAAFRPGEYSGALVMRAARPEVAIRPGAAQPVAFTAPSPLRRCQEPLILSGSLLLGAVIISVKVRQALRARARPPLVKGTLTHWRRDAPDQAVTVDLSALGREVVTIGSGPHCDIVIAEAGLEPEHARISAERTADGLARWMMAPLGRVSAGYRAQAAPFELQERVAYQMGEQVFTYLRDAEI